ncbi:60S ribosomal protein L22, putative [Plasmodium vivax]|uniref:Large ribosomal subunit protein eL22 n=6 Tax=Plasmodium vivax TaxID=5855 RepID=A5K5N3_PLAVS|nr:60S ribosomal protein L22, putative [Plasmodium vivax]KMZ81806.1 ribosomal protein L22e [Plasmodium vivax India VII]KMZ88088.1 ribosomal protein L22e [Plasmodium vivax Brazil I]KMZ94466.1 ribosomal protein L22e [Plasmodium vivax Mauritania I]KNA01183.1 ribosomal protein L22e [Plasmodium vivax North Korean]EDL45218.1 60S ribosomal protein L22, putative [Plasmodium vivax]|eukprot:XP_001614945.1 60S ribosomal protein L22 [Plasmodium vivax Sal-1]
MVAKKESKIIKKQKKKNGKKSKVAVKKPKTMKSTKGVKYILDCTKPVKDTILDISGLEQFFKDKIKVDKKTNNLKNKIVVTSDDCKIYITVHIPFSKRYIKYLAKKYLKMHQIRDFLRVIAKGKLAYEFKYFQLNN